MNKLIYSIFFTLIYTSTALASEAPAGELLSLEMLYKSINILILLVLLHLFAKKPIAKMLGVSAKKTKDDLEESKQKAEAVLKELEDYNQKLSQLESELVARKESSQLAIKKEKEKIIEDAKRLAKQMAEQTQTQINQNLLKAKLEIRDFMVSESMEMATKEVKKQIDKKKQKALLKDYSKILTKTG